MQIEIKKREIELEFQRTCIQAEYKMKKEIKEVEGRCLTYTNQQEAAQQIIQAFQEGKYLVILLAQPGAGKTGVILEVCHHLGIHNDDQLCVPTKNMFIISGMSDVQWKNDMQQNLLSSFKDNIHHRGEMSKIEEKIEVITNGLIVNDECHIAAGKEMNMSKMFQRTGLVNVEYAIEKSIRVLEVSATPDAVLWDLASWGTRKEIIKLEPGPSYKGFRFMMNERRIRKDPKFTSQQNVLQFLQLWQNQYARCPTKKYFPVRLLPKSSELMGWLKTVTLTLGWKWVNYNSDERIDNIDNLMKNSPSSHTIIFIKGFWRASKRIERKHVGGCLEESPRAKNVTSAAQGLIARFCNTYEYDVDELEHPEWLPVHYGNIESIKLYLDWFEGGCDYKKSEYSSTTLKSKGGKVNAKPTMVHHSVVTGLEPVLFQEALLEQTLCFSPPYTTREDANRWAEKNINFNHDGLKKKNTSNGKPRKIEEWNSDGTKNSEQKGTHMKDRGQIIEIPTIEMVLSRQLNKQIGGGGVRSIPVRMGEGIKNNYIISYKKEWMKP